MTAAEIARLKEYAKAGFRASGPATLILLTALEQSQAELERLIDTVEGLESYLDNELDVLWRRDDTGASEWSRLVEYAKMLRAKIAR